MRHPKVTIDKSTILVDWSREPTTPKIKTTIPCLVGSAHNGTCCGCLNAELIDGLWIFVCNECGKEAGRGYYWPEIGLRCAMCGDGVLEYCEEPNIYKCIHCGHKITR